MEVTCDNFQEALPKVEKALESCAFFSMDAEMTGLHLTEPRREDVLDDPEQRYSKIRDSAQKFLIMQLGLSMFQWNEARRCFEAQTFNFYVFPRRFENSDKRFCSQASSLEFLKKHKFDFNKFVYSGIPYLTIAQQQISQKSKHTVPNRRHETIVLTNESDCEFVQRQLVNVRHWLEETRQCVHSDLPADEDKGSKDVDCPGLPNRKSEDLVLEPCNSYLRAALYQELEKEFGKRDFYTTVMPVRTRVSRLKLTRSSPEAIATREAELIAEKDRQFEDAVGFGRVVKLMVACKKPFVGHNLYMDLCFFYQQFIGFLCPTFEEFRHNIMSLFPAGVYDTKYLAEKFPNVFSSTSLSDVFSALSNGMSKSDVQTGSAVVDDGVNVGAADRTEVKNDAARTISITVEGNQLKIPAASDYKEQTSTSEEPQAAGCDRIEVHLPAIYHARDFNRYQSVCDQSGNFEHEAGYDAFMTGAVFILLATLIEASSGTGVKSVEGEIERKVITESVQEFANRIFASHSDIPFWPLKGDPVIPDRSTLFHISAGLENLPATHEISARLADIGYTISRIMWVNPSSCYLRLKDPSKVGSFQQDVLASNWGVTVVPFHVVQEEAKKKLLVDYSETHGQKRKHPGDVKPSEDPHGLKWPCRIVNDPATQNSNMTQEERLSSETENDAVGHASKSQAWE